MAHEETTAEHPLLSGLRVALVMVAAALVATALQSVFGLAKFSSRGPNWHLSSTRQALAFWPPLCAAVGGFVGVTLCVIERRTSRTVRRISVGAKLGALCAAILGAALRVASLGRPNEITLFTPVGDVIFLAAVGGMFGAAIGAVAGRVFTQARASMAEATVEATFWLSLAAVAAVMIGG